MVLRGTQAGEGPETTRFAACAVLSEQAAEWSPWPPGRRCHPGLRCAEGDPKERMDQKILG